ncbi:hypothetical protein GWI33_000125 [Rhynchophorus ferrugineus]|uniref:Carboxypeptidase n=1 Tax=Rhynchophorus ferrugineus TaxID=354439 RepID=A0A834MM07_RHYFE|nr:hypothetical protein GWI33_000125 [Rhynchophorus ferrugineus]
MKTSLLILVTIVLTEAAHPRMRYPSYRRKPFTHKPLTDIGEPLIITPYLENNQIEEARLAAQVNHSAFQGISSYSGYFTVEPRTNGNLFFWFFPSRNDYQSDPVILWLQGGPGSPSLYGLFTENGPFIVEEDLNITLREYSWNKNHSVIYIDQPVGTGYSFTDEDEYVSNQEQVGAHLYSALTQFFTLFPEFSKNEFYIAGESYAGKYVPSISYAIYKNNPSASLYINLKGLLIGNGLTDPIHQLAYGDYLYQLGLLDLIQRDDFYSLEKETYSYIKAGDYLMASFVFDEIIEFYGYYTELKNTYNYLEDALIESDAWEKFIVRDDIRQAINVGSQYYSSGSYGVYFGLFEDISKSVAPWLVELLDNYRVLIYSGQLDVIVAYPLTLNYLQNLQFSAAEEYKTATRSIWKVNQSVAGYIKVAGNLTEVMVRNAGHFVPADQPENAYNLIFNFIRKTL